MPLRWVRSVASIILVAILAYIIDEIIHTHMHTFLLSNALDLYYYFNKYDFDTKSNEDEQSSLEEDDTN